MWLVSHRGQTHQLQWQVSDWFLIGMCCALWFHCVPGSKSATPSRWQPWDGSLPGEADGTASTPTGRFVTSSFVNCCPRAEFRAEGPSLNTRTPFYATELRLTYHPIGVAPFTHICWIDDLESVLTTSFVWAVGVMAAFTMCHGLLFFTCKPLVI